MACRHVRIIESLSKDMVTREDDEEQHRQQQQPREDDDNNRDIIIPRCGGEDCLLACALVELS